MLDEGGQSHHILQGHPVHHLDVVVSDQLGGGDWGEPTVIELTSHAGVTDLGWDREEVRQGVRIQDGRETSTYLWCRSAPSSAWRRLP